MQWHDEQMVRQLMWLNDRAQEFFPTEHDNLPMSTADLLRIHVMECLEHFVLASSEPWRGKAFVHAAHTRIISERILQLVHVIPDEEEQKQWLRFRYEEWTIVYKRAFAQWFLRLRDKPLETETDDWGMFPVAV